jgi:hypothetical protein
MMPHCTRDVRAAWSTKAAQLAIPLLEAVRQQYRVSCEFDCAANLTLGDATIWPDAATTRATLKALPTNGS